MKQIRKTFMAGVGILVPIVLTLYILDLLFNVVDGVFGPLLLEYFNITSIWIRVGITALIVFGLGLLTRTRLGSYLWGKINKLFGKVPLISKIYNFASDTTKMMIEKKSFDTVVRVEFTMEGVYSIGFLTNAETGSIFIPTTPNPTNGFLIVTKNYEILDTNVEDAVKEIISIGTIAARTTMKRTGDR